jgi:hypothetical protein
LFIILFYFFYLLASQRSAIFERLRTILHEGSIDKRVQYMIEVMFAIRKDGFKVHSQQNPSPLWVPWINEPHE